MPDKLVIVSGSSSGLGQAIAEIFLEQGWAVHGFARRSSHLEHGNYSHFPTRPFRYR